MKIFQFAGTIILPISLLVSWSCSKPHSLEVTPIKNSNIIFSFSHRVNGDTLKFDTLIYRTTSGNQYMVNDLQYFVSGVSLHSVKGSWSRIASDDGIHYIDARINATRSWQVNEILPAETYDTISFAFGLDEDQNITGRFPDPPERDMSWPDVLGGGYHYMKMDLKWKNDAMVQPLPFNFHLGIGQVYSSGTPDPDSIIGFVQNYFRISLPCKLDLSREGYQQVMVQMKVDKWFDGQYAFDFAAFPNGIMQNQEGMFKACMNGRRAFGISIKN